MKSFLKSSLYLLVFAIAGIMFQIACSNSDETNMSQLQTGKLIYTKFIASDFAGIYTCNYDGTDETQVPITFPANLVFDGDNVKISPDGQKIFFFAGTAATNVSSMYSCDIDGNNLQVVKSSTWPDRIVLGAAN